MDLMELMWSLSIELHWGGRVLAQMGIKLRGVCVCVGGGGGFLNLKTPWVAGWT